MKIEKAHHFEPRFNHKFFFDSNIWLYLLYPQFNLKATGYIKRYSSFANKVFNKDCLILTNLIQVSEMINVILNKEYKIATEKGFSGSNKAFRDSDAGKIALEEAKVFVDQVMKSSTMQSGIFTPDEMKDLVSKCDLADFNDLYFALFCQKQDCIMVTHDYDFRALDTFPIEVLSSNQNYF